MSDKQSKVFLVGDHNHPGGVHAVDPYEYKWMVYNGCSLFVLSKEEAQILLTVVDIDVDFGDGDNRWSYYPYEPLSESAKAEWRVNELEAWEYWEDVYDKLSAELNTKGW